MMTGSRTWSFHQRPVILSTGVVGGPYEAKGNIQQDFDILHEDMWLKQASFEKAQQTMMEEACQIAVKKTRLEKEQIQYFISGDLINQITPTSYTAKTLGIPYLGVFSACATTTESLALSALIINGGGANYILTGSSSHRSATERQYRYPTQYGGQRPPTAQWTVTGAGCALLGKEGSGPVVTSATIGKIVDMEMSDPFNMGGAMAPAAVDTIIAHLKDRKIDPSYYDLIITGDLGEIGHRTSRDLLNERGINVTESQYVDCGLTIYTKDQPVMAGASGAACAAIGTYGHYLNLMQKGVIKRMLVVATGALHSPLSIQQNDSIPCIAHAVSIEAGRDQL
ncbi:stage V sporulation protein AD [Lentibacillus saliphilus]|uniref:stage V sporulation protein AD n=1 Tax=Lentibacillus saliphilus TaxID=2737028 RepID=UPI001C300A9C|nr:stage V sporulation protein AD [Lentibacillus saliphilus]